MDTLMAPQKDYSLQLWLSSILVWNVQRVNTNPTFGKCLLCVLYKKNIIVPLVGNNGTLTV